jgi:hypothetical protein
MTHCALPALHEDQIHRGAGKAFVKGIRERSIKQVLLLVGERMVNEAFRQILELEVIQQAAGSPVRLQKMRAFLYIKEKS